MEAHRRCRYLFLSFGLLVVDVHVVAFTAHSHRPTTATLAKPLSYYRSSFMSKNPNSCRSIFQLRARDDNDFRKQNPEGNFSPQNSTQGEAYTSSPKVIRASASTSPINETGSGDVLVITGAITNETEVTATDFETRIVLGDFSKANTDTGPDTTDETEPINTVLPTAVPITPPRHQGRHPRKAVASLGKRVKQMTHRSTPLGRPKTTPNRTPSSDVSYTTLLRFTIPTLAIWLASPLMSLVDTAVVGIKSSLELAALGPATNVCDSMIYTLSFLAVATTNLLAHAIARGDRKEEQRTTSHALAVALFAGVGIFAILQVFGLHLIGKISGPGTAITASAFEYAQIRAIGAPAVVMSMVLQAALLGAKDSITPLSVVVFSGAINAIGDWVLVCRMGVGIAGAAWATIAAEYIGVALLGLAVFKRQQPRRYPFLKVPPTKELVKFLSFAGPIFFTLSSKMALYTTMTYLASACGSAELAAHQVMLRLFFFFTTIGDSLSQTAQAFLPSLLTSTRPNPTPAAPTAEAPTAKAAATAEAPTAEAPTAEAPTAEAAKAAATATATATAGVATTAAATTAAAAAAAAVTAPPAPPAPATDKLPHSQHQQDQGDATTTATTATTDATTPTAKEPGSSSSTSSTSSASAGGNVDVDVNIVRLPTVDGLDRLPITAANGGSTNGISGGISDGISDGIVRDMASGLFQAKSGLVDVGIAPSLEQLDPTKAPQDLLKMLDLTNKNTEKNTEKGPSSPNAVSNNPSSSFSSSPSPSPSSSPSLGSSLNASGSSGSSKDEAKGLKAQAQAQAPMGVGVGGGGGVEGKAEAVVEEEEALTPALLRSAAVTDSSASSDTSDTAAAAAAAAATDATAGSGTSGAPAGTAEAVDLAAAPATLPTPPPPSTSTSEATPPTTSTPTPTPTPPPPPIRSLPRTLLHLLRLRRNHSHNQAHSNPHSHPQPHLRRPVSDGLTRIFTTGPMASADIGGGQVAQLSGAVALQRFGLYDVAQKRLRSVVWPLEHRDPSKAKYW